MNDDYLWDKTGEPDTQIQQLERVLGTLRYQPRPLEISAGSPTALKANVFRRLAPRLAIAATIAVMLVGLGIWLGWQRQQTREIANIQSPSSSNPVGTTTGDPNKSAERNTIESDHNNAVGSSGGSDATRPAKSAPHRIQQGTLARDTARDRRPAPEKTALAADELREVQAAKMQLMLALRVASSKLNFAQKKTQSTSPENIFHNQHKIG